MQTGYARSAERLGVKRLSIKSMSNITLRICSESCNNYSKKPIDLTARIARSVFN